MHLFVIASGLRHITSRDVAEAVRRAAGGVSLPSEHVWQAVSPGGALCVAGVHHGARAAPRRYVARAERSITIFDGLAVDPSGAHDATDAHELGVGWRDWVRDLEGQFCAARIDLQDERAEILLDTFGLLPVFAAHGDGGVIASNSVAVIRSLLGLGAPDPLAVSSMIGLGWAADRHALLAGVHALAGGAEHVIEKGRVESAAGFSSRTLARSRRPREGAKELAGWMKALTKSATSRIGPVRCAVTAGRDSRLVLGLVLAGEIPAEFYTVGYPDDADVIWARRLADRFGFEHRTEIPEEEPGSQGEPLPQRLVSLADGLSDLNQMIDVLDNDYCRSIGCKLSGIGGEMARNGPFDNTVAAATLPVVGNVAALQRRVLAMKIDAYRPFMTRDAEEILDGQMRGFFDQRLEEGWNVDEVADLYFVFERIGCHAATAPRRASLTDDFFSPYCTRRYAEFCMGASVAERYVELPYRQLLEEVYPDLLAFPFKTPMPSPHPRRAGVRAARKLAGLGSARRHPSAPAPREPFVRRWFERHIDSMRELFAQDGSPLWSYVDRKRLHTLMGAAPESRRPHVEGLLRAATLFWYFHGPGGAQDAAPRWTAQSVRVSPSDSSTA